MFTKYEAGQTMIEWNVTRLMRKFDDKEKDSELKRKQILKNLEKMIFKDYASSAFIDVCYFQKHAAFTFQLYCCCGI